ncbi:MAG: phytoene desaturase family protein [Pseudomonadota bacterium]
MASASPFDAPGDPRPTALIIGAGFGGLAAGIRLGAKGYRVVMVDRLDAPGGRATARHQNGYRFDLGPTIVTVPHVFEELWRIAGRQIEDDIKIVPMNPFYEIRFPDGERFRATGSSEEMRAEVARLSPSDLKGYEKFLKDSETRYWFGFEDLGRRPMNVLWELIKTLPTFALLRADRSTYRHAAIRMRDERLRMAFSFHPLFIGGDPLNVTSMYSLVAHLEKEFGVHYAMGGAGALAEAMAGLVRHLGGKLHFGVDVEKITTENRKATGIELADGTQLKADIIVSNADAGHTYQHLLAHEPTKRWNPTRLKKSRWSSGLFVWHFGTEGTRTKWPDIGHHTIINGPRYTGLLRDIFKRGHLADDMSIYLHRPSHTDPTSAPEGCDTWYALAPVPHLGHANPVDWATETPAFLEKMQTALEPHLPGLTAHVTESHIMTPEDFRTRYRSPHGAGFSLEPRILQSAWFRPHNISEDFANLYLVGAGTHPGAGLPGVVSTAEVLSQLVPDAPAVDLPMAAQ